MEDGKLPEWVRDILKVDILSWSYGRRERITSASLNTRVEPEEIPGWLKDKINQRISLLQTSPSALTYSLIGELKLILSSRRDEE
jgi:hypothetical protein